MLSPGQPSLAIVRVRSDVGTVELRPKLQPIVLVRWQAGGRFGGVPIARDERGFDVADRVRAKMDELKSRFPDGIDYSIAYDTTPFIRQSVSDVVKTLLIAVLLVAIVVLAFLQNWRSVIIPLIAVPVAIVSTFAVMAAARVLV